MESTARYVLRGVLKYANPQGEMSDAQFIEMHAPSGRHARQVAQLRQAIVKAIVEEREKESGKVDPDVAESPVPIAEPIADEEGGDDVRADGIDVINIMARSSVDLGAVYKVARELFVLKGVLRVDGDVPVTQMLLDNMTALDFETLVGAYIASFTLPS